MKKTGLLKRAGVAVMTAALMVTAVACNTKIKVNFEAKASDYVKLGQYKGITVSVDEQAIENELIEKKFRTIWHPIRLMMRFQEKQGIRIR